MSIRILVIDVYNVSKTVHQVYNIQVKSFDPLNFTTNQVFKIDSY